MDERTRWEHVARRLESAARKKDFAVALLRTKILLRNGVPAIWSSPRLTGLWFRARSILEALGIDDKG